MSKKTYPHKDDPGQTHWEGCWKERRHHNCAVEHARTLQRENEELREEKREADEIYKQVMEERCAGDEVHCTCVPWLRKGLEYHIAGGLELAKDTTDLRAKVERLERERVTVEQAQTEMHQERQQYKSRLAAAGVMATDFEQRRCCSSFVMPGDTHAPSCNVGKFRKAQGGE